MPMCLGRKRTKKQQKTAALGGGDPRKKTSALGGGDPRGEARHFGNATFGIGLFAMNGIWWCPHLIDITLDMSAKLLKFAYRLPSMESRFNRGNPNFKLS